jgi:hypothetical protein
VATDVVLVGCVVLGVALVAVGWVRGARATERAGDVAVAVDLLGARVDRLTTDVAYLQEALGSERRLIASHLTDHAADRAARLRVQREGGH